MVSTTTQRHDESMEQRRGRSSRADAPGTTTTDAGRRTSKPDGAADQRAVGGLLRRRLPLIGDAPRATSHDDAPMLPGSSACAPSHAQRLSDDPHLAAARINSQDDVLELSRQVREHHDQRTYAIGLIAAIELGVCLPARSVRPRSSSSRVLPAAPAVDHGRRVRGQPAKVRLGMPRGIARDPCRARPQVPRTAGPACPSSRRSPAPRTRHQRVERARDMVFGKTRASISEHFRESVE